MAQDNNKQCTVGRFGWHLQGGRPVVLTSVRCSAPHSCSLLVTFDQRLSPLPRNLGRLIDGGNVVRRRLRARARAAANDGDSVARSISIRAVPRPFAPSFVCSFVRRARHRNSSVLTAPTSSFSPPPSIRFLSVTHVAVERRRARGEVVPRLHHQAVQHPTMFDASFEEEPDV